MWPDHTLLLRTPTAPPVGGGSIPWVWLQGGALVTLQVEYTCPHWSCPLAVLSTTLCLTLLSQAIFAVRDPTMDHWGTQTILSMFVCKTVILASGG